MQRLGWQVPASIVLLVACVAVGWASWESGKHDRSDTRRIQQVLDDAMAQLHPIKRGDVVVLTMPQPIELAGDGWGRATLTALPSGCVMYGDRPIIWPPGTRLDPDGTIRSGVGTFRVGQVVWGGGITLSAKVLKPSKEVTDVCPAKIYVELGDLELWSERYK
jgi:hypothetical protein